MCLHHHTSLCVLIYFVHVSREIHVEARGQLAGVSSHLPRCGSPGLNSGCHTSKFALPLGHLTGIFKKIIFNISVCSFFVLFV